MQLDTLTISERLHKAGLPQEVAKEWAALWYEDVSNRLATREDMETMESGLRKDITALKGDIDGLRREVQSLEVSVYKNMETMESGLKKDMQAMESGLELKMKTMESGLKKDIELMGANIRRDMYSMSGLLGLLIVALKFLG